MASNDQTIKSFGVRDLSVASFLYSCSEVELNRIEKDKLGRTIFHFTPYITSQKLTRDYWNLQAPFIQPKKLLNSLRDIKDIIFNEK